MRSLFYSLALTGALAACQADAPTVNPDGPKATLSDFSVIAGKDWTGNLTYTDYGTSKDVTIRTTATIKPKRPRTLNYTVSYPDEPWQDGKAKIRISKDGRQLDGHEIINRMTGEDGELIFVTQYDGEDDNKPAEIMMTYGIDQSRFYIRKDVKYGTGEGYLQRNIYDFRR